MDRYSIEATRITGRFMVIEDLGWAEECIFTGSREECKEFIHDLEEGGSDND